MVEEEDEVGELQAPTAAAAAAAAGGGGGGAPKGSIYNIAANRTVILFKMFVGCFFPNLFGAVLFHNRLLVCVTLQCGSCVEVLTI